MGIETEIRPTMHWKMFAPLALLLFLSANMGGGEKAAQEGVCGDQGDSFSLTVSRRWNQSSGAWTRTYHAKRVEGGNKGPLELEATQGTVDCGGGRKATHVRVLVKEISSNGTKKDDRLLFHRRHGRNVVLLNDGRSAQKLEVSDGMNAIVFTNRPLKDGELFEVRLDKRVAKTSSCFALGVMTHSPENVQFAASMHQLKNGTWMYHNSAIYGANRELSKYGKDLNNLQTHERVGVMRKKDGSLHYYRNDAYLGQAMQNIPGPVYGVAELWHDAVKTTIVY